MKIFKWILLILFLLLAAAFWYMRPLLKIGAGYTAKIACTCHYMQGRSLDDIHAQDLTFSVMPMFRQRLLEDQQRVKSTFFGMVSSEAQYIKGHGCVLLVNGQQLTAPPFDATGVGTAPNKTPELPIFDTLPEGLKPGVLKTAIDAAFIPVSGGETRAIAVLYKGHLVDEAYADNFPKDMPQLGWSMTKSITNALIGILVKNGQLSLEQDQLFPAWENDERARITLNNLMQMNSGLEWNEAYGNVSDATRMLFFNSDMGAYALDKPSDFEPNTHWVYSSGSTNILSKLIRQTLGDDQLYHALLQDSLFAKLGMHSAFIEMDQSGNFVGSSYGWATAQDWAKFGQLYLQDGTWNGERILPEGWVNYSRQAASNSEDTYGAHIWLKDKDTPHAPDDIYAFRGYQGQRVMVIPSRNCVIVRLGKNDDVRFDFDSLIKGVLAALPE